MTYILGINAYHADSSACLINDGSIVAAAEEERFRRIKHWAGFPSEAIKYCLAEAGIPLSDVEHVAVNQDPKANFLRKLHFTSLHRPNIRTIFDRLRNKQRRANVADELASAIGKGFSGKTHNIEHHLSHLSSAYHVSPFDEAVVVSVDGFGDFASTAWGVGRGGVINVEGKVFFPHSLGIFYQALTQWMGFPNYGDEYKVMGLAPYGQAHHMELMREIVLLHADGTFKLNLEMFRHTTQHVQYEWEDGDPKVGQLFGNGLIELLGPPREKSDELTQFHMDIAKSVQTMYEEAFFNLLNVLSTRHKSKNLCLAGGCAMNSVANGKVYKNTPFEHLYVQSAAGDAGGAIGAALQVWREEGGQSKFNMDHAYWGPAYSDDKIDEIVSQYDQKFKDEKCELTKIEDTANLCDVTAHAIASGEVVGWFQGRMEWGPRALGNRSILGDPRRANMKDILNKKIKRRESFRPFAPSILRGAVTEWFEQDDEVPFMMQVYPIRQEMREKIPAVTHVDGSGRLQTVSEKTNPIYHQLIKSFEKISGVPMVLNTSFNENEPVVCKPEEAIDCFLRTNMDVLVLGKYLIRRTHVE